MMSGLIDFVVTVGAVVTGLWIFGALANWANQPQQPRPPRLPKSGSFLDCTPNEWAAWKRWTESGALSHDSPPSYS